MDDALDSTIEGNEPVAELNKPKALHVLLELRAERKEDDSHRCYWTTTVVYVQGYRWSVCCCICMLCGLKAK